MRGGGLAPNAAAEAQAAGDKAWYFKQHEACAALRFNASEVERIPLLGGGDMCHFFWSEGEELFGVTVQESGGESEVVASIHYREGPVDDEMKRTLRSKLPLRLRLDSLRRRVRLSGMVHVYVAPTKRRLGLGEALVHEAVARLRKMGVTHQFTLADDNG